MKILLTGNTAFKIANFREGLVRQLISDGHEVIVLAPEDQYVAQIRSLGCHFEPLKMQRNGTNPFQELKLLRDIYRCIREHKPDMVFSYTVKNNIYSGISCRLMKVPFAPNVTGLGPAFNNKGVLNKAIKILYRFAFSRARRIFFQNDSDLDTFRAARLATSEQAQLLPGSGVDLARFRYEDMQEGRAEIRFLLVARLLWEKGIGLYVEAAREIRKHHPSVRFQVLGPLDIESKSGILRSQIDVWVEQGCIEYLGTTHDVTGYLADADCIVLPTYYNEGTPRSLLEAGAIGRAIITTDQPGCREVVLDKSSGYLIAPRDIDSLISACKSYLALESHERALMSRTSRKHVEKNYDEDIVIKAYLALLSQA